VIETTSLLMTLPNLNNKSIIELAQILQNEANSDPSKWKPLGYVSYSKVVGKIRHLLYESAKNKLTIEQYQNIEINVGVEQDTGVITVDIKEVKRRLPSWKETRIIIRPRSDIVVWTGKIL
jgi:hypothetical protein